MGKSIKLTQEQREMKEKLYEINQKLWSIINKKTTSTKYEETSILYSKMAKIAHDLHMSLKSSGYEPKHHKYMIENRGVPVESIEFYNHIHPVDDLLKFVDDVNANDDPEDTTIGIKFTLRIYTRRWGHYDHYYITRTEDGWKFEGMFVSNYGNCGKDCRPNLYQALKHDSVCYPKQIGEFIEYLWEQAAEGLTTEEVQDCFDMLGEWISSCELNTPRGIFEGLI